MGSSYLGREQSGEEHLRQNFPLPWPRSILRISMVWLHEVVDARLVLCGEVGAGIEVGNDGAKMIKA